MAPTNTPLARRHRTVPERAPRAFLVGDTKRREGVAFRALGSPRKAVERCGGSPGRANRCHGCCDGRAMAEPPTPLLLPGPPGTRLWNLAIAQLRLGRSAVLDGVARQDEVADTRDVARAAGARCFVVLTACSDEAVDRSRVEGRTRGIPGWYELDWAHVADVLARWEPPAGCDLHLDTVAPLESNTARLRDLLRR